MYSTNKKDIFKFTYVCTFLGNCMFFVQIKNLTRFPVVEYTQYEKVWVIQKKTILKKYEHSKIYSQHPSCEF